MKMPLKFSVAVFLMAAFSPLSHTQSASTVIDFEGFTDGTPLSNQVPGAAFSRAIILTAGVSLNEFEFPPHSGINVVSDNGGPVTVLFANPVKSVSGYFTYSTTVTVTAFDSSNHQLAASTSQFSNNEALSGALGSAPNELITVSLPTTTISRVTFTGAALGGSFTLDDLTIAPPLVASAPSAPPGQVIPPLTISSPLTLNTIPLGSAITATVTATGGYPPYTFAAQGAPAGITITPAGFLSGKPAQAGAYRFVVTVTDTSGVTQGVYLSFSVFGITTTTLPDAVSYAGYSQPIAAVGGAPPYTFSGSGFPGGINISTTGTVQGIATKQGSYKLLIQAVDANGIATPASIGLNVDAPAPLVVPPVTLPAGTSGVSYSQQLSATGGAAPYTWSLSAGTLPPGLRLSASGTVTGVPAATGTFAFTVQAIDSLGAKASGAVSVSIAPSALTLNAPPTLPSGIAGVDYPIQIVTASGGTPPYKYSLASGTLPPGITLGSDGVISGIPSTAGSYTFAVAATDSAGLSSSVSLSAAIRSAVTNLILSSGSLAFSAPSGTVQLPPPQTVQVQSSVAASILSWTAAVNPAVPWLTVTPGSGNTPGSFGVALTSQALSLPSSGSPYQAAIAVTDQGTTQILNVTLNVTAAPPQLITSANQISFIGSTQPVSQTIGFQNAGGGSLGFSSIASPASWLSLGSVPGSLGGGQQANLAVTANPAGLVPGYYRTTLSVTSSLGIETVPVTLFVTSGPALVLSQSGAFFSISAGGFPIVSGTSFDVITSSPSPVSWTATVLSGAPWLSTSSPSGTSSSAAPGYIAFTIDPVASAALAAGTYYGVIRVASAQAIDTPLDFQVVLNVSAASAPPIPVPSPDGLVFVTSASTTPAPQNLLVSSTAVGSTGFQVSTATADGHSWLSATPAVAVAAASSPSVSAVSVNPAGLSNGVYYGTVSYAGAGAGVPAVNVTLIVVPASSASCTSAQAVPARAQLRNNFATALSRPTPIAVQLLDNCGNPVTNGTVTAAFSDGDASVALALNGVAGIYSGTWYPRQAAAQVTVTLTASAPGLASTAVRTTGLVRPATTPTLSPLSTLHIFGPQPAAALAPGNIVQIYGSNLATSTATATATPLPNTLGGASVSIGGLAAPLFYASPTQINAQVPFELNAEGQYQIEVTSNGLLSPPDTIHVSPAAPGIAAALHSNGSPVTEQSPAKPGEALVLYGAGLGLTTPTVVSGAASPSSPLAIPQLTPTVAIGSETALVQFSGLTPGLVGLYQINLTVPSDAPNGDLSLVLTQGTTASIPVILPVHN